MAYLLIFKILWPVWRKSLITHFTSTKGKSIKSRLIYWLNDGRKQDIEDSYRKIYLIGVSFLKCSLTSFWTVNSNLWPHEEKSKTKFQNTLMTFKVISSLMDLILKLQHLTKTRKDLTRGSTTGKTNHKPPLQLLESWDLQVNNSITEDQSNRNSQR